MKKEYVGFYLVGRDDRLIKNDIDTEDIAQAVLDGKGSIRELIVKAVSAAAEPLRHARKKANWIEEYEDDIKTAGGDKEAAYTHYIDGRMDELALSLERDVVDDLEALTGGDDADDDDDEDPEAGDEEPEDDGDEGEED